MPQRMRDGRSRSGRKDFRRQERQARISDAALRQPARPGDRRDRHRQDRDAAGDGGRLCARRRPGICRRHQGRSLRHRGGGRCEGRFRQACQGVGVRLPARRILRGVLGPVRRTGPSGARDDIRDGAAAAVAADGPERCAGRRAEHRVSRSGRAGAVAARPEGSARDARVYRRACRRTHHAVRKRFESNHRDDPAPASGAGKPGRRRNSSPSRRST